MARHRTFLIDSLTLGLKLGFHKSVFSFKSHAKRFFISLFCFPFKKIK